jgi:predicted dehydrogenase
MEALAMNNARSSAGTSGLSRRGFMHSSAALAAALAAGGVVLPSRANAAVPSRTALKVGVIGCGGRGRGAAANILAASPDTEIVALGDIFPERVATALTQLAKLDAGMASRVKVPQERCFTGFESYAGVLDAGVDVVILATPPGFRPAHFEAAINAGKHVFMEKPVAVDPVGVRRVIEAAKAAQEKSCSVVAGTQRRHEVCYHEAKKRIDDGAIGDVVGASVYWNQGGLWKVDPRTEWSDMEWQIRNWLYFAWLSGDHIVEQHVHNLDVGAWYLGDSPVSCSGMGGRQVRTAAEYGHVFDHFAVEFEYAGGRRMHSYCRQIDGCTSRVEEIIHGTRGYARLSQFGTAEIHGANPWKWRGEQTDPYTQEHIDLIASITGNGPYLNHGVRIAESTLLAIMGRMSAYTGKTVTWKHAMESRLDLTPPAMEFGPLLAPPVPVPGREPLV